MPRTVRIDLMTEDKTRKAKARTIAVNEATDVKSTCYVGEHGTVLEVTAERIDPVKVVDKIRREVPDAKLLDVE